MINNIQSRIENIKQNGFELDFNVVFTQAFNNYKKIVLYAGLILFVFSFFVTTIAAIVLVSQVGVEGIDHEYIKSLEEKMRLESNYLWVLLVNAAIYIIITPFLAGFYKMADNAEKDEKFEVANMFTYFKFPYLKEIFVATVLISTIEIILQYSAKTIGIQYVGVFVGYMVSFFSMLTFPLIALGNLKAVEAIKASFIIVSNQPLTFLGLIITAIIVVLLGFFGCCIGILFTAPFIYSVHYAIYMNVIEYDKDAIIDEINSDKFD